MNARALLLRLVDTDDRNSALLVQRAVLGLVMLPHGAQKLLGWFGGFGFDATMAYLTKTMHLPAPVALLVVLGESIGALLLVLGLGARAAALLVASIMVGAVLTTHLPNGFFMNWFGAQQGEGYEFHLLALALAVPIAVWGGGRAALDSTVARALAASEGEARPTAIPGQSAA